MTTKTRLAKLEARQQADAPASEWDALDDDRKLRILFGIEDGPQPPRPKTPPRPWTADELKRDRRRLHELFGLPDWEED